MALLNMPFKYLQEGDKIVLKAGQGEHAVVAEVTVSKAPGATGVFVRVDKVVEKGSLAHESYREGEVTLAGRGEVYIRDDDQASVSVFLRRILSPL